MATLTDYKGLDVVEDATGDGGIALTDNFKALADRAPYQATANPGAGDDDTQGFSPGDQWLNTSTSVLWACVSNGTGAAVWKSLYKRTATGLELIPAESSERMQVSGNFHVLGYARFGGGAAPANTSPGDLTASRLFVNPASTNANEVSHIRGVLTTTGSGAAVSITNRVVLQPTGNSDVDYRSINLSLDLNTPYNLTNSVPATASYSEVRVTNLGNAQRLTSIRAAGLLVPVAAQTLGTIGESIGVDVTPVTSFGNPLTSTVGTAIGLKCNPAINIGSGPLNIAASAGVMITGVTGATHNVGVLIGTANVPPGNYAIYSASNAPSYFAGVLDMNSDTMRLRTTKTPSTASAAGDQGDICWDGDYIYVCVATDTWKRATLATW